MDRNEITKGPQEMEFADAKTYHWKAFRSENGQLTIEMPAKTKDGRRIQTVGGPHRNSLGYLSGLNSGIKFDFSARSFKPQREAPIKEWKLASALMGNNLLKETALNVPGAKFAAERFYWWNGTPRANKLIVYDDDFQAHFYWRGSINGRFTDDVNLYFSGFRRDGE